MANNEKFRYDPTPMNHEFPGQPDDCFDVVNPKFYIFFNTDLF